MNTPNNQNNNQDPNNPNKPNDPNNPEGQQPPGLKFNRTLMIWLMIIGLVLLVIYFVQSTNNAGEQITWQQAEKEIVKGNVEEIILENERVLIKFKIQNNEDGTAMQQRVAYVKSSAATKREIFRKLDEGISEEKPITATVKKVKLDANGEPILDIAGNAETHMVTEVVKDEYGRTIYETVIHKVPFKENPTNDLWLHILISFLPWILILGLIWFFFFRAMKGSGGGMGMLGNFGRSKHKLINKEMTRITFDDVAGVEEAKDEVTEIVEFLKNPKKFARLGGRVPRGILLVGLPGCGKTLLAKAMAGEAEVPFFTISGSDFVEMFVGVGASRVRDLFKQAKDSSPCVIFLDEIDAVGRKRGNGSHSGGNDEREQTLNAILVEMDGFDTNDQVIVIAATNRADVLDPALTRPGRFDRQIQVPMPDVVGRRKILAVHIKKVKASPDADLDRLARATPGFSGAELEALINEAAILATLAGKDVVEMIDFEDARDKVRFGRENRSRKIDEEERVATAYHEAGHAVIQYLLEHADPLHKVTIIPRGQALGATMSLPKKDRLGYGRKYMEDTMRVLCGGRIAEEKKTSDTSSGASMDIQMMTAYARHMVMEWGMSERLGFVNYGRDEEFAFTKGFSEETARIVDEEIRRFSDEAYTDARRILEENWDLVVALAEALLRHETLDIDDVKKIMNGEQLSKPTVSDLLSAETAKAEKTEEPKVTPKPEEPGDDIAGGPIPSPA